jgi:transmembrane sensor
MTNDPSRQASAADAPDWDAIARFLAGESPAEEAARTRQWLEEHPSDFDFVERVNAAAFEAPGDVDVEAALHRVHARLDGAPAAPRLTVERGTPSRTRWRMITGAALAAAAAGVFAALSLRHEPSSSKSNTSGAVADRTDRSYRTAVGERDSVMLADGSRVILGPNSRLTVPEAYGAGARAVWLEGDGYFDVRHDATTPFAVHVGGAVVEDVGTTFTVESDDGDTTTVSVLSGSVRLRPSESSATAGALLAAGDRGAFAVDGTVRAYPHTVSASDSAWTSGRLVFNDASLPRVISELRRWYGVDIRLADSSFANRHLTTSFHGESIDEVLNIISLSLGARVERHAGSAVVYMHRGPAPAR